MYCYKRQIFLKETDATGVLFFSQQLNWALEALESYFLTRGFSIKQMLDRDAFAMPVVHAEADFFSPLRVGDVITIELSCQALGTTSFTVESQVKSSEGEVGGSTKIVHVCISQKTEAPIPIPQIISAHLREL